MPETFATLDFESLGSGQAYDILTATIHPRPIAFVSTESKIGHPNLSPFSFFMAGGSNPISLAFSPSVGSHGEKDTLSNIRETGEFVVNLVHRQMAEQMNATSERFPPEVSEFEVAGLTGLPSLRVKPWRVAESKVQFECRLFQVVDHGDGPGAARYVIGEVLVAHVSDSIWDGSRVIDGDWRPISRMGGPNYLDSSALEYFQMVRPI